MDIGSFLDLFLSRDVRLSQLTQKYGHWTYALLFLVIFCETVLVVTSSH